MTVNASATQGGVVTPLTDAASIAWAANQGLAYSLTLGGNHTLANASDLVPGTTYILKVTQGAGGNHALSFGTNYLIPNGSPLGLSTDEGAVDVLVWWCGADGQSLSLLSISREVATLILPPTNFTASTNEVGQITLNWVNHASAASGILVQFYDLINWAAITTLAPDQVSYIDTPVDPGTTKLYRLITLNGSGQSSPVEATGSTPP